MAETSPGSTTQTNPSWSAESTIRDKRQARKLSQAQLRVMVEGIRDQTVSDVQLGAFLMAVCLQGMTVEEQAQLTLAMRDSGVVLKWPGLNGPVLDKHSTGGVGDLVSLVLAPMLAACGAYVPMISGRGLGHTGGTLDKLQSIPGFDVNPGLDRLRKIVREVGFAMVGQGPDLAPADRRMYAARDVTATVSCTPLIVASILSKKLAEGLDGLVMDIKTGNGAVMASAHDARELGKALVLAADAAGLPCTAVFTDMSQPLASSAGNALELEQAVQFLSGGKVNRRLSEVVFSLGSEMLLLGKLSSNQASARELLTASLVNGLAAERFEKMVAMQGGPTNFMSRHEQYLPQASVVRPVLADQPGIVQSIDTRRVGRIVNALGGGRSHERGDIDYAVGLSEICETGQAVNVGDSLAMVHAADQDSADKAVRSLSTAIQLGPRNTEPGPTIHDRISSIEEQE